MAFKVAVRLSLLSRSLISILIVPPKLQSSVIPQENLDHIGQLLTPRTWHLNHLGEYNLRWAGDNDCYTGNFDRATFIQWLTDIKPYQSRCLFVAAPDVVADADTTCSQFTEWHGIIQDSGFPTALVLQDGIKDSQIDWQHLDAVFVGGTTAFKMSTRVLDILTEAGKQRKWRHVGRVNSLIRMRHFWDFADSFDGTDYVHHPEEAAKSYLPRIRQRKLQVTLFSKEATHVD